MIGLVVVISCVALLVQPVHGYTRATYSKFDLLTEEQQKTADKLLKNIYIEAFDGQKNCAVTGFAPAKPRSLSFCHKFNDKACCPPSMDMENNEMFDSLMDLGLSCRLRGDVRDNPMAKLYCMNCDPQQPKYVRPFAQNGKDTTILVCANWARNNLKVDPLLAPFNRCGLMVSAQCLGSDGNEIDDRDRYLCGDDLIIPGQMFLNESQTALQNLEDFLNLGNLGAPALDDFHYQIVEEDTCADENKDYSGESPNCVMSAKQQATYVGVTMASDSDCSSQAFRVANEQACVQFTGEKCFNSAHTVGLSAALVLISLICLFLF